ncbi:MAG: amylo-alpha-1,6-glucosidase, partial [bacterium]
MRVIFYLLFTFVPLISFAQEGYIPAFKLEPNDLELTQLAQPSTYFDKVGRKFAVLGFESGMYEAWAYPLKLLRNFEFSFLLKSSTVPIPGKNIVRYISVTPEATTLTYSYQSFTVKAIYITPVFESGAIILLDVDTTEPLTIVCSFIPVLQPMWPAGLGGQYAYWDTKLKAYLISESSKRNHAYVGSPAAVGISYTPAHMLSDTPNQFKIEIQEIESVQGKYIPIILTGGKGKREKIKTIYQKLSENPELFYRENVKYYQHLHQSTMHVETPNQELNLAFEWAKVAYDNLRVENPDLGKGLVAGLGPSGTGGRPGFGWFFGGDAFINALSLNSYGAFSTVREALAFTKKWQRKDGKMAHELSQAEGYINWFEDYPYGYIHGDTTPYYIAAMYDYYKMSGDVEFIKNSWNSLKRAYAWCLTTDEDGDGLMDNQKAGLGALEFGALTDIQTDIYLAAVWIRATYAMEQLALAVGDKASAQKAKKQFQKARKAFDEKFWDEEYRHYSYAFNAMGKHVKEVTPWSAVGLMWELGNPQHSALTLEKLNSSELTTDWGIRSISIKSDL